MNIRLNSHSERLLKEQLAHGDFRSPEDVIERALESFARKESAPSGAAQRKAVREMLDFVKRNRVHLEPGLSVKDLIHEGHGV